MVGKLPDLETKKFKYIGPGEECEAFGIMFKAGVDVEVSNQTYAGQMALQKLPTNPMFVEVAASEKKKNKKTEAGE